jgi:hypothetical protein
LFFWGSAMNPPFLTRFPRRVVAFHKHDATNRSPLRTSENAHSTHSGE